MDVTIDEWVSIICADDAEWARLARAIGKPELANDSRFATLAARKRNEDALEAIVSEWTATRKLADVVTALQAVGVAAGACADSQVRFRGSASHRARILRLSRSSRSRQTPALRNPVADERDAVRSEGGGARAGAAY